MDEETSKAPEEQPRQEAAKKGGSKILLIIIAGAILVLGAGGFFAYKMLSSGKAQEGSGQHEAGDQRNALVALNPFILNLAEQGRFLKLTIQFELRDISYAETVENKIPQLRDAIITLVSSKSPESVASPEGKFQLKDELLLRANQAVGKEIFRNLYFTEFVMQ